MRLIGIAVVVFVFTLVAPPSQAEELVVAGVTFSIDSHDFGPVPVGESRTVEISYKGLSGLLISPWPTGQQFSFRLSFPPGSGMTATFAPGATGQYEIVQRLDIITDDIEERVVGTAYLRFRGVGVGGEFLLEQVGHDFGRVFVKSERTHEFLIRNITSEAIVLRRLKWVSYNVAYRLLSVRDEADRVYRFKTPLAPGAAIRVRVRFRPRKEGFWPSGLRLEADSPRGRIEISFAGEGVRPRVSGLDRVNRGTIPAGETHTASLVVGNDSDRTLTGSIRLKKDKRTDWSIGGTDGAGAFSIPPRQEKTIEFGLTPSGPGKAKGRVIVRLDDVRKGRFRYRFRYNVTGDGPGPGPAPSWSETAIGLNGVERPVVIGSLGGYVDVLGLPYDSGLDIRRRDTLLSVDRYKFDPQNYIAFPYDPDDRPQIVRATGGGIAFTTVDDALMTGSIIGFNAVSDLNGTDFTAGGAARRLFIAYPQTRKVDRWDANGNVTLIGDFELTQAGEPGLPASVCLDEGTGTLYVLVVRPGDNDRTFLYHTDGSPGAVLGGGIECGRGGGQVRAANGVLVVTNEVSDDIHVAARATGGLFKSLRRIPAAGPVLSAALHGAGDKVNIAFADQKSIRFLQVSTADGATLRDETLTAWTGYRHVIFAENGRDLYATAPDRLLSAPDWRQRVPGGDGWDLK